MNNFNSVKSIFLCALFLSIILFIGSFIIPGKNIKTVTVSGEAKIQQKNQVAVFSAGVSSVNDNKDTAVNDVNQKVAKIIDSVKTFGIPQEDIKTQNLSVYQSEETYYEEGRQKTRLGQWRVNNTIEVTLRNIDKASELTDLLTKSGATNVYGPNFSVEDTKGLENTLLDEAIKNATQKAEIIAKSSKRKLGKIINITEGNQTSQTYPLRAEGLGGGAPVESGTQTVQKTVTVTFELN